jgi:hypothetical protein
MKSFRIIAISLCVSTPLSYGMQLPPKGASFTTENVVVLPEGWSTPSALITQTSTETANIISKTSTETANLITKTSTETAARIAQTSTETASLITQTSTETATRIEQINEASKKLLETAHACVGLQQKTFFENVTYASGALVSGGLGFVFVGLGLNNLLDPEKHNREKKDPVFNYFSENVFYSSAKILVGAACLVGAGYLLGNVKAAPALVSVIQ